MMCVRDNGGVDTDMKNPSASTRIKPVYHYVSAASYMDTLLSTMS